MTPRISLYELNNKVRGTLHETLPDLLWVVAEINELNTNNSGHCYLELIEKDVNKDKIIAKARATIWAFKFRLLKPYFETTTGETFSSGMKVLLQVQVEFHELFGYSLNIHDIDPTYTVGDLARQKALTIKKLKSEGVFLMNKELSLPLLPSNIAIISSKTAAGLQDFIHQLRNNPFGYVFNTKLFPSLVQGKDAEDSIIRALDRVFIYEDFFDLVVIIRGGGSQTDLNCFNNYFLASHVAQFTLPVITGIGHEKDETVTDMVASISLKTPTAVAEFLIQSFNEFDNKLSEIQENIVDDALQILSNEKQMLERLSFRIAPIVQNKIANKTRRIDQLGIQISSAAKHYLTAQKDIIKSNRSEIQYRLKEYFIKLSYQLNKLIDSSRFTSYQLIREQVNKLDIYQQSTKLLDPMNILKRGYTLSYSDNKLMTRASSLKKGRVLHSKFSDGEVISLVKNIILDLPELKEKKGRQRKAK